MPAAKPNRIAITLRIDEKTHLKSKIIARKEDRPLNSQFEYWIKKCVEQYERENDEIIISIE